MRHADNPTARPDDLIFDNVSRTSVAKASCMGCPSGYRQAVGVAPMGRLGQRKDLCPRAGGTAADTHCGRVSGGGRISMQFQEPRLLPWRNAAENVNLVLSAQQKPLPESLTWLTSVDLRDAAGLYPDELSGGMAQRVGYAGRWQHRRTRFCWTNRSGDWIRTPAAV